MPEPLLTQEQKTVAIPNAIVIKDLANLLHVPVTKLIAELMKNGVMSSMNERIDYETAAIIAADFGYQATQKQESDAEQQKTVAETLRDHLRHDETARQTTRPPVVVVMGHVDHGKTKLLDTIRQTDVMAGEAGGITQHIGAYQVQKNGRLMTFIDTPGHEAFSAMRSRGAQVADIAVLVIAADDGIKPQTEEAIKIIQQAKLPMVVAINKIDKPEANAERVKQQLAEKNLLPESWGGKTITVPVSAQSGQGVQELLETVLLVAEVDHEKLKADPARGAVGSVIEAHIDRGEGPVATVVVHTGTLRKGDSVRIGTVAGRVRTLKDWRGSEVTEAGPSTPVKILGLKGAPEVGDILTGIEPEEAKKLRRQFKQKTERVSEQVVYQRKKDAEEHKERETPRHEQCKLNIVLRTDNLGSQEAILESLSRLESPLASVEVVSKGLGSITDADVLRADAAKAALIGFHVVPTPRAVEVARSKQAAMRTYTVIYDLLNDIRKELEALLPVEVVETVHARLKVLAIFRREKKGMIAGGRVLEGTLEKGAHIRVLRGETKIGEGTVLQLQQEQRVIEQARTGIECGLRIEGVTTVEVDDVIEAFTTEERRITLTLPNP